MSHITHNKLTNDELIAIYENNPSYRVALMEVSTIFYAHKSPEQWEIAAYDELVSLGLMVHELENETVDTSGPFAQFMKTQPEPKTLVHNVYRRTDMGIMALRFMQKYHNRLQVKTNTKEFLDKLSSLMGEYDVKILEENVLNMSVGGEDVYIDCDVNEEIGSSYLTSEYLDGATVTDQES